jgi:hypothetical protein
MIIKCKNKIFQYFRKNFIIINKSIYKKNRKFSELDILARKYGTDKRTNDNEEAIYHGYTDVYDKLFSPKKKLCKNLLEIGVREGWSHKMWYEFFPNAMIYGIDNFSDVVYESIDFEIDQIENDRIKIFIGDQSDHEFLEISFQNIEFDIIIDDGSHRSWHQQLSFKYLFPKLKSGGYYIIEDLSCAEGLREFREYDDIRSSTPEWIRSIQRKHFFSYYFSSEESEVFSKNIKGAYFVGELGVIIKK